MQSKVKHDNLESIYTPLFLVIWKMNINSVRSLIGAKHFIRVWDVWKLYAKMVIIEYCLDIKKWGTQVCS